MLSNAYFDYFLAKFRFDTAENEPAKKLQNFAKRALQGLAQYSAAYSADRAALSAGGKNERRGLHPRPGDEVLEELAALKRAV